MWDQYRLNMYWASKAVFGVACPVCRGVMTVVQVEPHPDGSGSELHTLKMSGMRSHGVPDRRSANRRIAGPIVFPRATERTYEMFSAGQYRAKAAEFTTLLADTPRSPNETSELRNLEQTYTTLADNEEWMAINIDRTIRRQEENLDVAKGRRKSKF